MKSLLKYIHKLIDVSSGFSGIICLAVIIAIVLAGFWPFNFFPKNKVKWLQNKNGISFYGQGMVISSGMLQKANESLFPDKSISLELRLKPLNEPGDLPHIIDLYDGKLPEIIAIGQWRSHLIIQSRNSDPAQFKRNKPYKERGFSNALLKNRDVFITIISDEKGSAAYINGMLTRSYPGYQLLSEYKDEPIYIIIGNASAGQGFWNGEIMGLAIYNRALAPKRISENYQSWMRGDYSLLKQNAGLVCLYPFNERQGSIIHNYADLNYPLIIPKIFKPVQRIILEPPWLEDKWNLSFIRDVAINLFGFIPFGFFISAFLAKTRRLGLNAICFNVFIAGFALSLSIELAQAYLPTRYSQLSDLILNTIGTAIGIFIFNFLQRTEEKTNAELTCNCQNM